MIGDEWSPSFNVCHRVISASVIQLCRLSKQAVELLFCPPKIKITCYSTRADTQKRKLVKVTKKKNYVISVSTLFCSENELRSSSQARKGCHCCHCKHQDVQAEDISKGDLLT